MTRRERLERKLEKREEWADKRRAKANATFAYHDSLSCTHDIAFNTQPGHIPLRAKIIRQTERAFEDMNMANHHTSCAAGIESALERSIFSDDSNAAEALEKRIADHEAERTTMREANKIVRAKPKNERSDDKVAKLVALGLSEAKAISLFTPDFCGRIGFAAYEMSNLGGRITADRKRLESVKHEQKERAAAEAAPNGVVLKESGPYCNVRFAEKPDREVLDALRNAGFRWMSGSWGGYTDKLPNVVKELLNPGPDPLACQGCGIVTGDVRKREDGRLICDLCATPEPEPIVIKGAPGGPDGKWDEVQAIQDQPFIYVKWCGSHWYGDEEDDVKQLAEILQKEPLGPDHAPFYSVDPCAGVEDPNRRGHFVDGPRLYRADGIYSFSGNFLNVSCSFGIDTNHKPTIDLLTRLIDANMHSEPYQAELKARDRKAQEAAVVAESKSHEKDAFWMVPQEIA